MRNYIIGHNINAKELNNNIKRKEFASSCDKCNIPRGVSTKLHKELIKQTQINKEWNSHQIYNYYKTFTPN